LEQAQRELEQALNQLRQEEREETLRDLEARFREMLAEQRVINDETARMDQIGRHNFRRAEELQLADLSTRQRALSDDAATCLHILEEDATTIVFPRVVGHLSEDMALVAERLASLYVGAVTQEIEREIVETLQQMLEAIQRMQQENEQRGGMPIPGSDGPSPLLPTSAELKLLRASQHRVNARTIVIEESRREKTESDDALTRVFRALAARQAECASMARELHDRQQQP
jgi:hypothetical protein